MNALRKWALVLGTGLLLAVTMAVLSKGVSAQAATPASEGDHLEAVRKIGLTYIDALNANDLSARYALLADDVQHYEGVDFNPMDKAATRAAAKGIMAIFPGFQTEVHMSSVSADCRFVTFIWTSSGKFNG